MLDILSFHVNQSRLVDYSVHQTEVLGLFGIEQPTCKHQLLGSGMSDATYHEGRDSGRRNAQPHLGEGKLGLGLGNDDVGSGHNAVGSADACAVDHRDDSLVALVDGLEQLGEPLGIGHVLLIAIVGHGLHVGKVGTGAEGLAVAFEDDHADIVTIAEPSEGFGEFANHFGIQGIAYLGPIEVDPRHAFSQLYFDCIEFHVAKIGNFVRKRTDFGKILFFCILFDHAAKKISHMQDENFRKELEELFRLFKRLLDKESFDGVPGVDPQQLEQLKAFMAQFDDVKDKLDVEMIPVDPFSKMMVSTLVKQLREQLGPEADEEPQDTIDEILSRREEELQALSDASQRYQSLIETIDEQLKNPELSDEEIDALLDKRSQISAKMSEV